jgi:hypothetical protein
MKAIKKMWSLLSAAFMVVSMTAVFSPAALAANCTLLAATEAAFADCVAVATGSSETITIPTGFSVSLTANHNITNASILLQAGSNLDGGGTATLTFSGSYPGTASMRAPIVTLASSTNSVAVKRLIIIDESLPTVSPNATILLTPSGGGQVSTAIEECKITCSSRKLWAIESSSLVDATIKDNTFNSCTESVYIEGNNGATLILTGNEFVKSGISTIDSAYLQPSSTIANNKFDPSDAWPAFDIGNLGVGSTFTPTDADYNNLVKNNSFYPVIVRKFGTDDLYNDSSGPETAGASYPAAPVTYKLDATVPAGVTITYGSVSAPTTYPVIGDDLDCIYGYARDDNRMCVLPGTGLTLAQFPQFTITNSSITGCKWYRDDDGSNTALTAPITNLEGTIFVAKCTLAQQQNTGSVSVPTTGGIALIVLGVLLAGLAVVRLRYRHQ